MTKFNETQINAILKECTSIEELNRLARLQQIYLEEFNKKLDSIWIIKSKIDKIDDKLKEILYGK